jgi:hypothetical protein
MEHWWNAKTKENRSIRRKKVRFQLRLTLMPYVEAWARDWASEITGQRKTGAMTRYEFCNLRGARWLYCMLSLEGIWVRNVARMGEKRNSHVFVVGKPERITWKA